MTQAATELAVNLLTRENFAAFGDVIETAGAHHYAINQGTTERFHDLGEVDVASEGGKPLLNIFRGEPFACPIPIRMVERHPLGSQAFVPLSPRPYLVVVAEPGDDGRPGPLHAFMSTAGQGVNYRRNVWHHPLLSLEAVSEFLVVDRGGPGDNLEEVSFNKPFAMITSLPGE
jgi:ureidoglycolate lyase